jgi:hypothetical protein
MAVRSTPPQVELHAAGPAGPAPGASDVQGARCIVAIPVKDEASHIGECLEAFAGQQDAPAFEVLLLLNNCSDATAEIARGAQSTLPHALQIRECILPPPHASAGDARRLAMQQAASCVGADGVLMTTDADARVASNWIASNLAALNAGADAVAGCVEMDPEDAARLPSHLHATEDRVQLLTALLDEIASILDPDPADPWPRHAQHSGASIAVRAGVFHRVGGIPAVACAEDRAFFAALRAVDARIRHCSKVRVVVSGRLEGRAQGGMADTLRRRLVRADEWLDDCLEPTADATRRAAMRARVRRCWKDDVGIFQQLAEELGLPVTTLRECLRASTFGVAWQRLSERSPLLQQHRIRSAVLEDEIREATALLDVLVRQPAATDAAFVDNEVRFASAL